MMKFQVLLISVCFILFISCQSSTEKIGEFKLLPLPQQFEITGTSGLKYSDIQHYYALQEIDLPVRGDLLKDIQAAEKRSKAQIICSLDESLELSSEGYTLVISEKQIHITGKDKAGLLYGFMTLEQLMEDAKEQDVNLPLCSIKDFPMLSYRAIHIDIKHHREKTDYYYQLLDRLTKYKVNAIIAEVEDKIKYERQPEVGSADALSINDWKKLCNYAKERNIEISPLIQGLGHASFILKHDKYKDLRDDPESDWAFNPLDPKTYEVQFDLYLDAIEATPHGKYLHIGGDEVHTTGRNSGMSPLELQLMWLNKVCKFAEEHGRIPIFWDDMPLKHAGVYRPMFDTKLTKQEVDKVWEENEHKLVEFLDQFPKNCIYMRWNYASPQAIGNIRAMQWFRDNGMQVMGATAGQRRWVLMPLDGGNIENIKSFAASSIKNDLNGLLLTLWDDDSPHFELYMRGIMAFAEYSWAGERRTTNELKATYRHRAFGYLLSNENFGFVDRLEIPVGYWKNALLNNGENRNNLVTMSQPIVDGIIEIPDPNNKGEWSKKYAQRLDETKQMLKVCDSISDQISEMKQKAIRNRYSLEIYEQVNELVKFSFKSLVALENYDLPSEVINDDASSKNIDMLPEKFTEVRSRFEEVYSKTRMLNKPPGYILDQDHHQHLANQTISFDWQFYAEILFLEKIEKNL